jgi:1-aminocyclopropane-1-carboxylate deaminase/D-cysteine desulfhydrase-like pyridoxal-dependent ACC family enzyme
MKSITELFDSQVKISSLHHSLFKEHKIQLDILRLDTLHENISGNKWFKLKYNLQAAFEQKATGILSFGGAHSNHLHALAYSGKLLDLPTIGIIRGEEVENPTLTDCKNWGMQLKFISRENYREKASPNFLQVLTGAYPNYYIIPEGGDNELGRKGCEEILDEKTVAYNYITCSIGTATTYCGLVNSAHNTQKLLGFSALKGNTSLRQSIEQHTSYSNWEYIDDYHFGGFARRNQALYDFTNWFQLEFDIALDYVYTAKMFYGILDLIQQNKFALGSRILAIHTGGLQGNRA